MTLTQDTWDALPGYVREADEARGYPLRTWLGGLIDQVQPTADALAMEDLANPALTPPGLLDLITALAGVDSTGIPSGNLRDFLASTTAHYRGSAAAIVDQVARTLTGSKYILIECPYAGHVQKMRVATYATETPATADTAAAVVREAPAWLALTVETLTGITYTVLLSRYSTYAALTATGLTYAELAALT